MDKPNKKQLFLLKNGIQKQDVLLVLLILLIIFVFRRIGMPSRDMFQFRTEITLAYMAKQQGDRIYVIDSGHSRLICFDRDQNEIFEITDPSDNGESILYIDDLAANGNDLYIAATEWDGMRIAREVILLMDQDGQCLDTIVERDYSSRFINKHRFRGTVIQGGKLIYTECLENSILVHRVDLESRSEKIDSLSYSNAFNAVGDIVIDENGIPVILNKNGKIQRFQSDINPTLLYMTEWEGEEERIPFSLAIYDGKVFFMDIRKGAVIRIDTAIQDGVIALADTDAQTVSFTPDGKMLLPESEGVRRTGKEDVVYFDFDKPDTMVLWQKVQIVLSFVLTICLMLFIFRLIVQLVKHKYTLTEGVSLAIVASVLVVTGIISTMLLFAFRTSYREKIEEQLESAAFVIASQLSEDEINSIRNAPDFDGEAYHSIIRLMENSLPVEQSFYSQIYCDVLRLNQADDTAQAIAYLDQSIGVFLPLDDYEKASVQQVYDTRNLVWNSESADVSGTYMEVKAPVIGRFNEVVGAVAVGVDTYVIDATLTDMQKRVILSVIAIVLLIWVTVTEFMAFLLSRDAAVRTAAERGKKPFPAHLVRILVFFVFGAYNLSSTFLPVYVLRHSELFSSSFRSLAASLPLTVNIFAMGIMSLFCAGLVRRAGMKRIMIFGSVCALCGNLLILTPTYFTIFAGLLLDGIGEGLIMNALYVMLAYLPDEEDRRNGFTVYNAACLSGINFGMLMGSLLAVALGQRPIFFVAALTWVCLLILGTTLVRNMEGMLDKDNADSEEQPEQISAFGFVSDKAVLSFIVLIQNPYIIFNSFVFYLVPVFCSDHGYLETTVSILIMLYSQIAVLSGDYLTERLSSMLGGWAMYLALCTNIIAVLIFVLTGSIEGLVIALLLLGFSAAYGKPVQQSYFLQRKAAIRFGEDRAIGVYNFSENIGESLGPIVFSRLMGASVRGYYAFLGLVAGCCGAHILLNTKEIKREKV